MRTATQKEIDKFIEYRANHVALVQRIGKVVFDTDLSEHDKDKIEANGEELNLFALRNSMLNGTYHPHRIDKNKLNKLTGKHVKSQKHHPEYWDDSITARNFDDENPPQVNAYKMPKRYLLEMCCDWSACALYRNSPMFSWYNKTCTGEDARFLFTDNQKEYIIECISRIASKIKEENLHYPNVDYTAKADSPKIDFGKKLNESKEDVIYSKEFKEWFGDWENDLEHSSKVVDKDGKPLAVYHGSLSLFDSFDPNMGHNVPAIWHTDRPSIASHWSNTLDIHRSPKVVEKFENLKSLVKELESKDTPFEEVVKEISNFTEENFDTKIKSMSDYTSLEDCKKYRLYPTENYVGVSYGYEVIYNSGSSTSWVRNNLNEYYKCILDEVEGMVRDSSRDYITYNDRGFLYKNYLNIRKPLIVDAKDEPYHNVRYRGKYYNTESLAMYAKERGYDGVIVKNVYETDYENKKGTDYIVFNPNQIKSATDNNGSFSKGSDNFYEKILHKNNKWVVTDHTGKKNLGTYDTKEEAEKRLKQVEYFKHINESLTDSREFRKWFGNSVVRDSAGNPLILYHGTPSTTQEITVFDSSKASNNYGEDTLIYATDSKEMAEMFSMDTTEGSLNFTRKLTGTKGKVYPLYMRLEHPMDFRNLTEEDIDTLIQAHIEYRKDRGETEDQTEEELKKKYLEEIKKDSTFGADFVKDKHLGLLVHPRYIHIFKEHGYDGIICPMEEWNGIKGALEYAVISANQVKSIDNTGTFDIQSSNIYEKVITSFGGKVPISNKDKDQILKFCKKAVEDGMKPTKYTEEEMANPTNASSGSIASNTPENNIKVINLGDNELTGLNEAYVVCSLDGRIVDGTYTKDLAKAKDMRKELADKYHVFFQLKKVPDKEEKIKESSEGKKTCVFTFGRYQPPTKGHLKVWETLANTKADAHYIYTSHTKDRKKNPLDYNTKVHLIELSLKENNIDAEVVNSEAKTIIDVVVDIANKGFTDIKFVGGSDRLEEMISLIKRYDNVPNKDGKYYHFNSIEGISAGERDPDSDDLNGISGTKLRQLAIDGDFESFKRNLAFSDESIAKEIMNTIQENLK